TLDRSHRSGDAWAEPSGGGPMRASVRFTFLGLASLAAVLASVALSGCRVRVVPGPVPVYVPPPPPPVVVAPAPEPAVTVAVPPEPAPVVVEGTVYPVEPPPDPIPEFRPPAPGYDYAWVNGYWDWTGYDWSWYNGYWVPRAEYGFYVAPRFVFVDGRPVYY